jgi:hypothetical protein
MASGLGNFKLKILDDICRDLATHLPVRASEWLIPYWIIINPNLGRCAE